jgi:hypothetical protein
MNQSSTVISVGAVCFGIVVGYVTYRTLLQSEKTQITDLSAVLAAVGGGVVAERFDDEGGDSFGWYAIGLLAGVAVFLVLHLTVGGGGRIGAENGGRGARLGDRATRAGVFAD